MKMSKRFALALTAVCLMSQLASAQLVITEVQSSSDHSEDWFELTNTGGAAVDLENYYWDDGGPTANDGALFPAYSITPNESIILTRFGNADLAAFESSWGLTGSGITILTEDDMSGPDLFSGLSSGGDQIEIWDGDPNPSGGTAVNLVASVSFGPTSGTFESFEWDTFGIPLGRSVVGEFGAYQALHDGGGIFPSSDVASPGITATIPEPASIALTAIGLVGLLGLRRK